MKTIFAWLIILIFLGSGFAYAGDYTSSAHGNSSNGVKRTSTTQYGTGNCAHCHEQHASIGGVQPDPKDGTPVPDNFLLFKSYTTAAYDTFCLQCHVTSGFQVDNTAPAIGSDFADSYNHSLNSGLHTVPSGDETLTEISSNKHIYCVDCHNAHYAGGTPHTEKTSGNEIISTSPLYRVNGAAQSYSGASNWSTPTQASYTLQTATKEYEICFKCHSGANANVLAWGVGPPTGALAWTDVGLNFNTYNKSLHPVTTTLDDAAGTSKLATAQMVSPWNVGVGATPCTAPTAMRAIPAWPDPTARQPNGCLPEPTRHGPIDLRQIMVRHQGHSGTSIPEAPTLVLQTVFSAGTVTQSVQAMIISTGITTTMRTYLV